MQQKIVDHLRQKYNAEAIILHGSRAKGLNRKNSDWDFYVFTKEKLNGGTEVFDKENLDITLIQLPISTNEIADDFGNTLADAKIIFDNNNLAENIIREAKRQYSFGRKLTDVEYNNRKNYMTRVLERMEGTISKDELFFLHLGYFYEKAIQYWFELKNQWSKPVYEALPLILNQDEEYAGFLRILYGISLNQDKLQAAKLIYQRLFK